MCAQAVGLDETLRREIDFWRRKRNAVILAHFYQRPEVQEIADFVGDSLQLAQQAARLQAEVAVVCGVHFMAESVSLLCPQAAVLLPDEKAGCPLADTVTAGDLRRQKEENPQALIVSYINTSAAVKAASDICCTSSNAAEVVKSLPPEREVIFVPDKNLGNWVQRQTGRQIKVWEGFCGVHAHLTREEVLARKALFPEAKVLVHPECAPEVTELADGVFSTAGILRQAQLSDAHSFIIGTEEGLLYQLRKHCPGKKFYLASEKLVCEEMKRITLEKVLEALKTLSPRIEVPEGIAKGAKAALDRMLALGKGWTPASEPAERG